MRERRLAAIVVALLLLAGITGVAVRTRARRKWTVHPRATVWQLRYEINIQAGDPNGRVLVSIPKETARCRIIRQEMFHPGLRATPVRQKMTHAQQIAFSVRRPGEFKALVQFDLHFSPEAKLLKRKRAGRLDTEQRAHYLRAEKQIQALSPVAKQQLAHLGVNGKKPKLALVDAVFGFCSDGIGVLRHSGNDDGELALTEGLATPVGQARAMVMLCRAARIPARLVTGFDLATAAVVAPHTWVEVFLDKHWVPYDPLNGFAGRLPASFVPVCYGGTDVCEAKTPSLGCQATFSLRKIRIPSGLRNLTQRRHTDVLDLTRLPVGLRETLALVLLLPLGALLTALCRNVIGIRTFGTFTPSLLALSFVYADWQQGGAVTCVLILLTGLTTRFMIDGLKLLMVPRLSVILTAVVLAMVFSVSILDYLVGAADDRVVLLPLVILTMLVERFHITETEDGVLDALKLLGGTLIVAGCCFALLNWRSLGITLLSYPEAHCGTLAALILVGRYTGYRVTELWRFRDLTHFIDRPSEG